LDVFFGSSLISKIRAFSFSVLSVALQILFMDIKGL